MSCKTFKPLPIGVARATTEHMPFTGHRTCAQWGQGKDRGAHKYPRDMTDAERQQDAVQGSAKLLEAIERAAA